MNPQHELQASHRILSMLENACEHSEQVLDNVPSVFVMLDKHNRIIRSNRSFCDLVGATMGGILHRDFTSFFSVENRERLLHQLRQLRADPLPDARANTKLEIECTGLGGETKPFFWRIFRLDPADRESEVISLVGSDLSELYQSELKLMSIFSSIPLGLLIIDRSGLVMEVLSEYCPVLLNQASLTGCALPELLTRADPERRHDIAQSFDRLHAFANRPAGEFQSLDAEAAQLDALRIDGPDNSIRWVRTRFQPVVRNQKVEHYLVVLEDITTSHAAQAQIEKAKLLDLQAKALYNCAIRDPLSGLYTRLFMNDGIGPLVASTKRGNFKELAFLMLDIDHFKKINDSHGHDAGDKVIRAVGEIIKACIRDTDIPVRYGGEEFLLALPSNDSHNQGGAIVAERIRAKLANEPVSIGPGQSVMVTTSCGVAYCHSDDSLESLIMRADRCLYQAKHAGRNRVCIEPPQGE